MLNSNGDFLLELILCGVVDLTQLKIVEVLRLWMMVAGGNEFDN